MKISVVVGKYRYELEKDKTELDKFVLSFSKVLSDMNVRYVIVSGYVAILFGRSRLSEDIDLFVETLNFDRFCKLWNKLTNEFWCIITSKPEDAFYRYLMNDTAVRFAKTDKIIPNIEFKFPVTELEKWALENPLIVYVDAQKIPISNIELQIAYKLYLGSEKDIEDAVHLYTFFEESLDRNLMQRFIKSFSVENLARRYLGWPYQK